MNRKTLIKYALLGIVFGTIKNFTYRFEMIYGVIQNNLGTVFGVGDPFVVMSIGVDILILVVSAFIISKVARSQVLM
jgi:hypothetical protein